MLFRFLPVASVLLFFLASDVQASQVYPSLLPDVEALSDAFPGERPQNRHHRLGLRPSAKTMHAKHRTTVFRFRATPVQNDLGGSGELKRVLAAISAQRGLAHLVLRAEIAYPFQYFDILRLIQMERHALKQTRVIPAPMILPLPASGWLLGSIILCSLLLNAKRRRSGHQYRQPLRYRTA